MYRAGIHPDSATLSREVLARFSSPLGDLQLPQHEFWGQPGSVRGVWLESRSQRAPRLTPGGKSPRSRLQPERAALLGAFLCPPSSETARLGFAGVSALGLSGYPGAGSQWYERVTPIVRVAFLLGKANGSWARRESARGNSLLSALATRTRGLWREPRPLQAESCRFSGHTGDGLIVGLDDLRDLF